MIRSLWIARTGMDAQQTQMDVIANNLANVGTTGFKRQRAVFEDLLYQTLRQPGAQSTEQSALSSGLQVGTLQLATFINEGGLQSGGENLYYETASSGTATVTQPGENGAGVLNQGYVESSNVNVAEELVSMIVTQRAYELNSRAISTADQMLARLTQL